MKAQVVITDKEYRKGKPVFTRFSDWIDWVVSAEGEVSVSRAIDRSGAKVAVLGVERYHKELYEALERNARPGPALIARHGVGYDGMDLEQCRERRIFLTITPGALDQSVAEHAFALLLALARGVPLLDRRMREGSFRGEPGFQLRDKSIGVAGFGAIGRRAAWIASRGFGMEVHAFDSLSLEEQARRLHLDPDGVLSEYGLRGYFTDFEPFIRKVQILTIHLSLSESTRRFFNRERFALMNRGTILINTSRGALIDEQSLYEALVSGTLKAAGLDVFEQEPYVPAKPGRDLRLLANVALTPHVASDTLEANEAIELKVVENIRAFLDGRYKSLSLAG